MAVREHLVEEMTAEELLAEMVREGTPDTHRERLRERIVEMHRPPAMEIARRYRYRGVPVEGLLQAACVGLAPTTSPPRSATSSPRTTTRSASWSTARRSDR